MKNAVSTSDNSRPPHRHYGGRRSSLLALLIATLILSFAASAGPIIQVHLDGFDPSPYAVFGRSVVDPANNQRINSNQMDGGRFEVTLLNAGSWEGEFEGGSTFYTFCIEPREFVTIGGTYTYELVPLEEGTSNIGGMGAAKAELLKELFGRFLPEFSAPLTTLEAGALQIAIWEIVREDTGTLNVTSGDIYFYTNASTNPAGTLTRAQQMLDAIDGSGPKLQNLVAMSSVGGVQDLVGQVKAPEPGTFALAGLVLFGLGFGMRRRKA